MEQDPLAWQLEQVEKLKELAAAMGWKVSSKQYKFELNRIHQQAKGEEASADPEEKEEKITWPPFKGCGSRAIRAPTRTRTPLGSGCSASCRLAGGSMTRAARTRMRRAG
jgi:hypothetical protein